MALKISRSGRSTTTTTDYSNSGVGGRRDGEYKYSGRRRQASSSNTDGYKFSIRASSIVALVVSVLMIIAIGRFLSGNFEFSSKAIINSFGSFNQLIIRPLYTAGEDATIFARVFGPFVNVPIYLCNCVLGALNLTSWIFTHVIFL